MRTRLVGLLSVVTLYGAFAAGGSVAGASATPQARGSSTQFTFSGRLSQPDGTYDFKFQLYNALTKGASVAGPVTVASVAVAGKTYSTPVDFGSDPFDSSALYMQVSWSPAGSGTFTKLSPRVELVAVPYALGLKLPASESGSSSGTSFSITNTGSGRAIDAFSKSNNAIFGESSAPSPGEPGVWGASLNN